jgi:hypothetical protein
LVESPPNSGNKMILVAGGLRVYQVMTGAASGAYSTSEIYDFGMDSWSAGPDMNMFLCDGRAVTIRNRHFWIGGRVGATSTFVGSTANILEYDVPSGKWITSTMVLLSQASGPVVIPYNL